MSDKEPRRRKKRKDLQPPRKVHFSEDVHTTDDQFLLSSKSEAKDSDQELEEEIVISTHQPSVFAKFVFVLLFSGLVVSLSFIFISLHGTDRGDVDIFNGHSEEIEGSHGEHDFHNHDHNNHDPEHDHEHDIHDQDHDHDIHDHDEETSEEESFQANIADYFPSIGSILSFNDEQTKEIVDESISDNIEEEELPDEQLSEPLDPSSTDEYVSSSSQESIEDAVEDTEQNTETPVSSEIYPDASKEPESASFQFDIAPDEALSDQNVEISPAPEADVDEQDDEDILENDAEYSDSYTSATKTESPESVTESYTTSVAEDISPITSTLEEQYFDEDYSDSDNFIDTPAENTMEEENTYYEKESITNEDDFKIKDQLDDLEEIFKKEFSVDDNGDDHDEDDDEYDDNDELDLGTGDEFDFWQF